MKVFSVLALLLACTTIIYARSSHGYTICIWAGMLVVSFNGIHADAPHLATIPQAICGWLLILAGVVLFFLSLYGASSKYMPSALVYLGRISYGMYIFHITMFWLVYEIFKDELASFSTMIGLYKWRNNVGFIIALLATVIISLLSYRFFEKNHFYS